MSLKGNYSALRRLKKIFSKYRKATDPTVDGAFAGQHTEIAGIFKALGITGGYIVDIAASDGYTLSPTLGFFKDRRWTGLAVEMDPAKFATLAFIFADFPGVSLVRNRVIPSNIGSLLAACGVAEDFTLLNLDIDSYDLHVIDAMFQAGYLPKVISMEINEKIPPPVWFSVDYDETHVWSGDDFFGCSLAAASSVVKGRGYVLHSLEYNNALFVRAELAQGRFAGMSDKEAYDRGYRNRPDRKELFFWNSHVEHLLDLPPHEVQQALREKFKSYDGKYTLKAG